MLLLLAGCCCTKILFSQSAETLTLRSYRQAHERQILDEFLSFLAIPNVAADSGGLHKTAAFLMDMMTRRGISQVRLLEPLTVDAPPVVYGQVDVAGATHTVIFYAHYDGQPVNPAQWASGLSPFTPRLVSGTLAGHGTFVDLPAADKPVDPEWRIYARGASDDKAGVAAILNAYGALRATGLPIGCNLKFFFEGEEEAGSPHLAEILEKYKSILQSDVWIFCDGPVHQSGKKQVVFGVRGDAHLEITVYGPKRPLHSGHYGNWAPNPGLTLARLLSSMKDDQGKVLVRDFYKDVIAFTPQEQQALREIPSVDDQMKKELGIAQSEMPGVSLGSAINLPSLNINGMQSGNVGKLSSNVIASSATADLDLRLVLGNDWQRQQQKVIQHIRSQGFYVVDNDPTDEQRAAYSKIAKVTAGKDGYNAQRTSMDLPIAKYVVAAVRSTTSEQVVLVPTLGGSLPLFLFQKYLDGKTITVPIANHDNNQHAENENIRLQNFWNGIETMASLMMMQPK